MKSFFSIFNNKEKSKKVKNRVQIEIKRVFLNPIKPTIEFLKVSLVGAPRKNPKHGLQLTIRQSDPFTQETQILQTKIEKTLLIPLGIDLSRQSLKLEVSSVRPKLKDSNKNPFPIFTSQKQLLTNLKNESKPVEVGTARKRVSVGGKSNQQIREPKSLRKKQKKQLSSTGAASNELLKKPKIYAESALQIDEIGSKLWAQIVEIRSKGQKEAFRVVAEEKGSGGTDNLTLEAGFWGGSNQIRLKLANESSKGDRLNWGFLSQVRWKPDYEQYSNVQMHFGDQRMFSDLAGVLRSERVAKDVSSSSGKTKKQFAGAKPKPKQMRIDLRFESINRREYFVYCARERQMEMAWREEWTLGRLAPQARAGTDLIRELKREKELKEWKMEKAILTESRGSLEQEVNESLNKYVLPEITMFRQTEIEQLKREYQKSLHVLNFKDSLQRELGSEQAQLVADINKIMKKRAAQGPWPKQRRVTVNSTRTIKDLLKTKHRNVERLDLLREKLDEFGKLKENFQHIENLGTVSKRKPSEVDELNLSEFGSFLSGPERRRMRGSRPRGSVSLEQAERIIKLEEALEKIRSQNSSRQTKQELVLNKIQQKAAKFDVEMQSDYARSKDVDQLIKSFNLFRIDIENLKIKLITRQELLKNKLIKIT